MQQRLGVRTGIEIARLSPIGQVADEPGPGGDMFAEPGEIARHEEQPSCGEASDQDQEQGGKDALDPAAVELRQRKAPVRPVLQQDARDEEAGDDEENIDPDETAGGPAWESVEHDHRQNGGAATAGEM